jgi:phosphoribosylformylglycinamidine cyclo-ligase
VARRQRDRALSAYERAGVDYDALDAGKRNALTEALATSPLLRNAPGGGRAIDESRGEPAFVFEVGGQTLAIVLECLGTKSLIARALEARCGAAGFDTVAYDTVAAVVNDLCCVGAVPLVVNAYFATGSSDWYGQPERQAGLLRGWRRACEDAGATWGGGESPSLSGLVAADEIELAGSAVGIVSGGEPILGDELSAGDEIVLVDSSGLHANGASLARRIADELPGGYDFELASGTTFGEALLTPSVIYVPLVRALLDSDVAVHYLSHITGHGFLKLMRPRAELTYEIDALPAVPEVLSLLVQRASMSMAEAYRTFNMGAGFAVYCAAGHGERVVALASGCGLRAHVAGRVRSGPRQVVLSPVDVTFGSDALDLAPRG